MCGIIAAMLSLAIFFASPAMAQEASLQLLESTVTTSKHPVSLWSMWSAKDAAYKKAHPWTKVWAAECKRTGIPCTEKAWKHLKSGTLLTVPAPQVVVAVSPEVAHPEAIALAPIPNTNGLYALVLNGEPVVTEAERIVRAENMRLTEELAKEKVDVHALAVALKIAVTFLLVSLGFVLWLIFRNRNSVIPAESYRLPKGLKTKDVDSYQCPSRGSGG